MNARNRRRAGRFACATAIGAMVMPAPSALGAARSATATHLNCNSKTAHAHRALHCGVSVSTLGGGGHATAASGVVLLNTNVGHGTFSNGGRCTLVAVNRRTARCSFIYTPARAEATKLYAGYAGDATHAASHTSRPIAVKA